MKLLAQLPVRLMLGHTFTLMLCTAAPAQDPPQAVKNMLRFAGRWECADARLTIGDKHYTTLYWLNFTAVNDNTGLVSEEGADVPGLGSIKGTNMIGYDPNLRQMHIYSIDNLGTCHDHWGYWTTDDELYVQYEGVVEGRVYVEQIWISLLQDGSMRMRLTGGSNGSPHEHIEGVFVRKGS